MPMARPPGARYAYDGGVFEFKEEIPARKDNLEEGAIARSRSA
jgi:hypothetical protein